MNDLEIFKEKINKENFWKYYEIKTCLWKDNEKWTMCLLSITLTKTKGDTDKLLQNDKFKFLIENREIETLPRFLEQIINRYIFLNNEDISTILISKNFSYDFKPRPYSKRTFDLDYACYIVTAIGEMPQKLQKELSRDLIIDKYYFENLGNACNQILGINFGGSYFPFIRIFAPIFIQIEQVLTLGNLFGVKFNFDENASLNNIQFIAFGVNEYGQQTNFNEVIEGFKKSEIGDTREYITDENSTHIKIILKYKTEILEEFYLKKLGARPIEEKLKTEKDTQELLNIKDKKILLKKKYEDSLSIQNNNAKGLLLEEVISGLFSLIDNITVIGGRVLDGIHEIDLVIRNNNQNNIWQYIDPVFFIECKNWNIPVGQEQITVFKDKLKDYGLHTGILVSKNGITGTNYRGAKGKIKLALKEDCKIIILDENDIKAILNCADLTQVLDKKYGEMYL